MKKSPIKNKIKGSGGHMKVGDYVGKINNDWMKHNNNLFNTSIAAELFHYDGPEPLGVIVGLVGSYSGQVYAVDIMTSDGVVIREGLRNLQVIER